jgi:hypothetical protein
MSLGAGLGAGRYHLHVGIDLNANGQYDTAELISRREDIHVIDTTTMFVRDVAYAVTIELLSSVLGAGEILDTAIISAIEGQPFDFGASIPMTHWVGNSLGYSLSDTTASLYAEGRRLRLDTLLTGRTIFVDKIDISNRARLHIVPIINSQSFLSATGEDGFIERGEIPDAIELTEYVALNGTVGLSARDTWLDLNIGGTVEGVRASLNVGTVLYSTVILWDGRIDRSLFEFGDGAEVFHGGRVVLSSPSCPSIEIAYTGTKMVNVFNDCTEPRGFAVNMDNLEIVY